MDIVSSLEGLIDQSIFKYSFAGGKILGFAILAMRWVGELGKSREDNLGLDRIKDTIFFLLGGSFMIFISDWLVDSIEMLFSGISNAVNSEPSDIYYNLIGECYKHMQEMFAECTFFYDYFIAFFENLVSFIYLIIALFIGFFGKLADLMVSTSYLIQRLFIIQFLKLIFPLCIGFATHPKMDNLFYGWIKSYIGVFVLGLAYIGVIGFCNLMPQAILASFKDDSNGPSLTFIPMALIVAVILTTAVKIGLFKMITQYVYSFFR